MYLYILIHKTPIYSFTICIYKVRRRGFNFQDDERYATWDLYESSTKNVQSVHKDRDSYRPRPWIFQAEEQSRVDEGGYVQTSHQRRSSFWSVLCRVRLDRIDWSFPHNRSSYWTWCQRMKRKGSGHVSWKGRSVFREVLGILLHRRLMWLEYRSIAWALHLKSNLCLSYAAPHASWSGNHPLRAMKSNHGQGSIYYDLWSVVERWWQMR